LDASSPPSGPTREFSQDTNVHFAVLFVMKISGILASGITANLNDFPGVFLQLTGSQLTTRRNNLFINQLKIVPLAAFSVHSADSSFQFN
jgi:hypothetical protein